MPVIKICRNCETPFKSNPYRAERARFCSHACRASMPLEKKLQLIGWRYAPSGCWLWEYRFNAGGYGVLGHGGGEVLAHRASWIKYRGPIPDGMDVLHACDVRPCINPDHLFLGTDADNVADMDAKGRRYVLRGEEQGAAILTEEQVSDIRSRPKGYGTGVRLAREFGVSPSLISLVRLGKAWSHV